jgi:1-acyl-sn-glycerol-3-phosphate acyltransferase
MQPIGERVDGDERSLAAQLRFVANRHIFRAMLATSGLAAVLMHGVLPRRHRVLPDRRAVWSFAKLQARNLARLCGVEVAIDGLDAIATEGPYIFTPNHQSHFDIVALLGFLPGHNRFAAKTELFADPILGPVLRTLGMVPIDRDHPGDAIRRLGALDGHSSSLIIFPEGTRTEDGTLLPFKKGPFVAAIELGLPVVPIAIRGSLAVMPKGGRLGIHPGRVEMHIDPPIPTRGLSYADRDELRDRVRASILRHLDATQSGSASPSARDRAPADIVADPTLNRRDGATAQTLDPG